MNNNWTTFLNKRTAIVSDIEGYIPISHLNKIKENAKNNQLIFLGDLFDHTTIGINVSENPERCCVLQLLKLFVDNPNVKCIMGNREINKIKMTQLCQFKSGDTWWKNDDKTTGNDFIKIYADNLVEATKDKPNDIWLVDSNNFKQFWPYWNDTNPNIGSWNGLSLDGTLHKRYLAIFGVDPKDGTMSAQNTANGMCCEIFGTADYDDEFKAAVVFVVFARLLDPTLYNVGKWEYDGLLYKYFMETPTIAYAELNDMIILFSHGGVESGFSSDISKFKNKEVWNKVKTKYTQSGGAIETLESTNIFNEQIKKTLERVFDKTTNNGFTTDVDMDIQIINSLGCAIFNSETVKRLGKNYKPGESPIQSTILGVINDTGKIMNTKKKLVNVFGHIPTGIGYIFGNNKQNGNYICCDYSMSLFKNKFELVSDSYDTNNLVLYLDAGKFFLKGNLKLTPRKTVSKLPSNMKSMTKEDNMKIFIHDNTHINPNNIESQPLVIKYNNPINIDYNGPYYYHGLANVNGTNDISIYSMMGPITYLYPKTIILQKDVGNLAKLYNKLGGGKHKSKRHTKQSKRHTKQSKRHTKQSKRYTKQSKRYIKQSKRYTKQSKRYIKQSKRYKKKSNK
jgi:hypothetical protein